MSGSRDNNTALAVRGLTVSYDRDPVVIDVSFDAKLGKLIGIVGPNGAGKSTMIKAIVGTQPADSGDVEIMGASRSKGLRRLTYVPQRGSVDWDFPVTVYDVVCQGRFGHLGLFGRMKKSDKQIVADALEKVAMTEFAERQIGELSGGQQQRVFLARALATRGDVYLMDEPFAGVDAKTEAAIVDVLRALRDDGKTVLVVHHDLSTVRDYFDEVFLLNRRLIAFGPTDEVFIPEMLQRAYGGKLATFGDGSTALF